MRLLMTTIPPDDAPALARALLEARLIACCNILPAATSMYWWQGAIATETESLLLMKAPESGVEAAMQRLAELHPYDVPEIVVIPVSDVSAPYLQWVQESCRATLED